MLKRLRQWLGWGADSGWLGFGAGEPKRQPTSATHGLFTKQPPGAKRQAEAGTTAPPSGTKPDSRPTASKTASPTPQLSLGKPPDNGFDPYNTGAFNRSQSWERISRRGR